MFAARAPLSCVRCGEPLGEAREGNCPGCGLPISDSLAAGQSVGVDGPGAAQTAAMSGGTTRDSPPAQLGQFAATPSAEPGIWPGSPPSMPLYPQPAPPSYPLYGQAPGQAAPPSVPLYGQQMYGQPPPGYSPYAPGLPPGYPTPASPPARKSRAGLIIGIVAAALVAVLVTSVGAALTFATRSGTSVPAPVRATGTPTAIPHETVLLTDPMTAPIHRWANDGHCSFQSDGYHIGDGFICFAPTQQLENVSFTAQVRQVRGDLRSFYGLVFRHAANGDYYNFLIAGSGFWRFGKVVNHQYHDIRPITRGDAVLTGDGPINTLTVWAIGTHLTFFVNSIEVGQADDNTYSFGYVGVEGNPKVEVVYTNVDVGLLSLPPQ